MFLRQELNTQCVLHQCNKTLMGYLWSFLDHSLIWSNLQLRDCHNFVKTDKLVIFPLPKKYFFTIHFKNNCAA